MKVSWKMLFATIIGGIIYGFIGEMIFKALRDDVVPSFVLTLAYFTGLFLFVCLVVYLISKLSYSQYNAPVLLKTWIISFICIIAFSMLFEVIYDLIGEKIRTKNYESYLFLIDQSGSMLENDPDDLRYAAVEELIDDKDNDFKYGAYYFDHDINVLREMGPKKAGKGYEIPENRDGMTAIKGVLERVLDDYEKGDLDIDENTRVILLTDGYPTDVDIFTKGKMMKLLQKYADKRITVSTVGLIGADDSFMEMIAEKTGGQYVKCNNVSQLNDAFKKATEVKKSYRNLLGYRNAKSLNWLLGIMRVLLVALLGVITAVAKTAICEKFIDTKSVLVSSTIGGILAGICIEIGMNTLGINDSIMRLITCVLIAFTVLRDDLFIREHDDKRYIEQY